MLILDGLDQLAEAQQSAVALSWLPTQLPPWVKLITSLRLSQSPASDLLWQNIRRQPYTLLKLEPMSVEDGTVQLDTLLQRDGRKLTLIQRQAVLTPFQANGRPLYLKLAYEITKRWHSYDTTLSTLASDIPSIIRQTLEHLKDPALYSHEPCFVERALSYIQAGRYQGLSEEVLAQALALDEEVVKNFKETKAYKYHPWDVKQYRLPPILWSRLYFDLEAYLVEQEIDGVLVSRFFHREFSEVVAQEYLNPSLNAPRHAVLAQVFDWPWDEPIKTLQSTHKRRLMELSYHLAQAKLWEDKKRLLICFSFLLAKLMAERGEDLLTDIRQVKAVAIETAYDDAFAIVEAVFRLLFPVLQREPAQLPGQLLGRLQPDHDPEQNRLRQEAQRYNLGPWLEPLLPTLSLPSPALVLTQSAPYIRHIAPSPDGRYCLTVVEKGLQLWRLPNLDKIDTLGTYENDYSPSRYQVQFTPDGKTVISTSSRKVIGVWHLEDLSQRYLLEGHDNDIYCLAITPDGQLLISGGKKGELLVWSLGSVDQMPVALATYHDKRDKWQRANITRLALTPNGSFLIAGTGDGYIKVWNMETLAEHGELQGHNKRILTLIALDDNRHLVSVSEDHMRLWDLEQPGEPLHIFKPERYGIKHVVWLSKSRQILVAYAKVFLWISPKDLKIEKTLDLTKEMEFNSPFAVSSDGSMGAIGTKYPDHIEIFDLVMGKRLGVLTEHKGELQALAFLPNSQHLLSTSDDETLRLWDLSQSLVTEPQKTSTEIDSVLYGEPWEYLAHLRAIQKLRENRQLGAVAGISPDGQKVIAHKFDESNTLQVLDLETGQICFELKHDGGERISAVALSPDGSYLLTANTEGYSLPEKGELWLWDMETGQFIQKLQEDQGMYK